MFHKFLLQIEKKLIKKCFYNCNNYLLGLSRSSLALGTLLTLVFNPVYNLIYELNDGRLLNPLLDEKMNFNHLNFFVMAGVDNTHIMKLLAIIILIIVISGYFIKITAILHWWISISFMLFSSAIDGGDQIANNLTLLLIPICLFDKRHNHWQKTVTVTLSHWNLIPLTFNFLIRLQIAIIYFHAAIGKLDVQEWKNGTAIYYWFNHSVFGMPDWLSEISNMFLSNKFFIIFLTYGVIIFELILFIALGMTYKKRKILFIPALIFHFLIILYHGIFSFFFSILAGLIFLLLNVSQYDNQRHTYKN